MPGKPGATHDLCTNLGERITRVPGKPGSNGYGVKFPSFYLKSGMIFFHIAQSLPRDEGGGFFKIKRVQFLHNVVLTRNEIQNIRDSNSQWTSQTQTGKTPSIGHMPVLI